MNKITKIYTHTHTISVRNINSDDRENKVVWAKFAIHFESAPSGFESMFYCCEHTNWWMDSKLLMKARLASILNCHSLCGDARTGKKFGVPDSTHTPKCADVFLLEEQIESPLFTRPSKRFRLRALRIPVLCRLPLQKRTTRDRQVLLRRTLHFDL